MLPTINPQDIEIQGQFKTSFRGLKRQPILGFRPGQQIYQIDPNRKPFMGNGEQAAANLPISTLSRPAPPSFNALNVSKNTTTFARLGYGSYHSPEVKYWGAYPFDDSTSYVGLGLNLSSSDGHLDNRPSSFRFLNARAEYGVRINQETKLQVHAWLQNDFNHPAVFNTNNPNLEDFPIKDIGYNAGLKLSRFSNDISGWKLNANVRSFKTTFDTHTLGGSINAVNYNGSFSNQWALGHPGEIFSLKVGARGGNYDPRDTGSKQWGTVEGGIAYKRLFNYKTHLHIAARFYYVSDVKKNTIYPGGTLAFDHWFANHLKITGKIEGKPTLYTVEQLHEENRFLGYNNQLVHTYAINATGKAAIKYYRGSRLHFGVRYSNYQDYAYFLPHTIPNTGSGPDLDTYEVKYQDATNFRLFAGLTQQLVPERFWFTGKIYLQHPKLANGDKIPFQENWGIHASLNIRPIDRISLEGWGNYTGKRHTGINDQKVGGYLLIGGRLDLKIVDNIGVYGKVVNLLNQHYQVWQGYQERPIQFYGGITINF